MRFVSILRHDELLFPRGSTVILPGDVVTFLLHPRGEERLQQYLSDPDLQEQKAPPLSSLS
ncbi:MAG: hypothetical protein JO215_15650 [Ktedonobacteraceae bacterium]|nr:hypothetical protein [Ktedonobacteraceae bacterium]